MRNRDLHALKILADGVTLDNLVDESKSASLASHGTLPDTGEIGITVIVLPLEDGHDTAVFHTSVFHDALEHYTAHYLIVVHIGAGLVFQCVCYRKERAGIEPATDAVVSAERHKQVGGNVENSVLQILQLAEPHKLAVIAWVAHYEIAEAEPSRHGFAQVDRKRL